MCFVLVDHSLGMPIIVHLVLRSGIANCLQCNVGSHMSDQDFQIATNVADAVIQVHCEVR